MKHVLSMLLLPTTTTPTTMRLRSPLMLLPGILMLCVAATTAAAQTYPLTPAEVTDSVARARRVPMLATELLATYRDTARLRYLDNRFRLEMLTGKYRDAAASLAELRSLRAARPAVTPSVRAERVQYEIHVAARNLADSLHRPFADAFAQAFRDRFATLDNATAAIAARAMLVTAAAAASDLRWAAPDQTGKTAIAQNDALTWLHVLQAAASYREFAALAPPLVDEDEARRYIVETNVPVKTPEGATVCAIVVRPRNATAKLPALLQLTIYADSVISYRDALRAASNGYAGVTGHTRGKACSSDTAMPYVHEGTDAVALINWIAAQPWSDGRVGMYGGSYSGFTPWAAAKYMPAALKAIMVGAPVAPGVDVPMEGNVFWNFIYPWTFYTTNNRWLDNATYFDNRRWNRMNAEWYRTGRAYRDLEKIDGTPNPLFAEWLSHPTLDAYWQSIVPQREEYARINIPVLQTTGYFYGGPGGALYYYRQHHRYNPRARHYLLAGPYDHIQAQRGVVTSLGDTATYQGGYEIDPAAQIDIISDLRYQWFDYAMRGAPLPALLKNRVTYQVMGANTWKSAASLDAAARGRMRLYVTAQRNGARYRLSKTRPSKASVTHRVDLADRSDLDVVRGGGQVLDQTIDSANAVVFVSDPLAVATEMTGVLSGHLEFIANARDFDFIVSAFELMPDGRYFLLPSFTSRASHLRSMNTRTLLTPGQITRADFAGPLRMTSRQLSAGSRLVVVISVLKGPGQQINYGSGKDVSDETIADARPLEIRWLQGTYFDFPISSGARK